MLIIYASELSACVGMNRYTSITEAIKKVWKRCDKDSYNDAIHRSGVIVKTVEQELIEKDIVLDLETFNDNNSKQVQLQIKEMLVEKNNVITNEITQDLQSQTVLHEKQVKEILSGTPVASEILQDIIKSTPEKVKEILTDLAVTGGVLQDIQSQTVLHETKIKEILIDKINLVVKDSVLQDIKHSPTKIKEIVDEKNVITEKVVENIKSYIQTSKGSRDEKESLEALEKIDQQKIIKRNDTFYKKTIKLTNGHSIILGGKIDGLTQDGTLIEMKNRQYRFFDIVPIYEKVQVYAYMILLDKTECKHVQNFKGKTKCTMLQFDKELWDTILEKMSRFVSFYRDMLNDSTLQDNILDDENFLEKSFRSKN